MATQQVLAPPARAGFFLVFTIESGDAATEAVRDLVADLPGITRGVAFRVPGEGLDCVLGIGSQAFDRLFPDAQRPAHLHTFQAIEGSKHTAVSTPGDLLVHVRCAQVGPGFELVRQITDRLAGAAKIVDEVHGFMFFDMRDLLGFVDGTENPEGGDAVTAAIVGEEDPAYAGSSYVLVQKYLHDLTAWKALSVEEQEKVIGRTKLEDVELADEVKPSNSHVALNVITDAEGNARQIVRQNMPFGTFGDEEFGTYFIGYAADPGVTEQMLHNMFIGNPVGNYDRILDFSTAVTGSLYFVPTADFLEDPSMVPAGGAAGQEDSDNDPPALSGTAAAPIAPSDGSLGIGSLRPR